MEERKDFKKVQSTAYQNVSSAMRNALITMEKVDMTHPIDVYQKFSREPIVFFKNMGFAD
jgi:hypothetical protein